MSFWTEYTLESLAEITSSKRIFMADYCKTGIPFYRSKEIIDLFNKREIQTELFISEKKYLDIKDTFGVPASGDILLTSVGTLGVPYLVKEPDIFYFKDGNLTWFRNINSDIVDPKFLFIVFASQYGKQKFAEITIGSTQSALTIQNLKRLKIRLPSIKQQQAIAEILSALDDKIELNLQMNKTLEEMANALYKHWFVDFGPFKNGKFVESELGMIPEGWVVKKLGDIVTLKYGKALKSEERLPGQYNVYGSSGIVGSHEEYLIPGPSIILGRKGNVGSVFWEELNSYPIDTVYYVNDLSREILNYIFLKLLHTDFKSTNSDSVVPGLNRDLAHRELVVWPAESELDKFMIDYEVIENKKRQNLIESSYLKETRDYLLPKLISGEIRVKEAQKKIKELV
jgi:type I restriction enzyme S subunit